MTTQSSGLAKLGAMAIGGRPAVQQLVLVVVAALVFFTNLGGSRLMDRDEPRNAGCAAEMLDRHDWVVPTFNAELRTHKPVLTYWFIMSGYSMFGVNEFGARFWSAILGVGTVLMTYHIGRRVFNAAVGFWAGVVTSASLWFAIASRIATPDSVLVFFSTLPILIYVLIAFEPKDAATPQAETRWREGGAPFPRPWWVAVAIYSAMGMAILAKGPVGIVLPTAVLGMFLLIARSPVPQEPEAAVPLMRRAAQSLRVFAPLHFIRTAWSMRPVTALIVSLAVSLPWYILVHQRTDGAWTRGFFLDHNLGRATAAMEGHGGGGLKYLIYIFYYPIVTMVAFLPWSVFLVESVIEAFRRIARRDPWRLGYALALSWIGVYLGAFTVAATKLPSYVTPMYPALGLIVAAYLYQLCDGRLLTRARAPVHIYRIVIAIGIGTLVAVPLVARKLMPGGEWLAVLGLIPLASGIVCLRLFQKNRARESLVVFGASSVIMTTAILGGALWYIDKTYQKSDVLISVIRQSHSDPKVYCYGVLEPSWVFYLKRPIREYHGDPTPVIEGLADPAGFLITAANDADAMRPRLPAGVVELARIPRYLRPGKPDLVLLGRSRQASVRSATE